MHMDLMLALGDQDVILSGQLIPPPLSKYPRAHLML